jgi:hypothetical protein
MTIQTTIIDNSAAGAKELAQQIAQALRERHAATPFANALRVSEWLHASYGNPRIGIVTNEDGNTITIGIKPGRTDFGAQENDPILRITLR